jgi:hypothetical protein
MMKPPPPFARRGKRHFPLVEACFQSDLSGWGGSFWPGDEDDSPAHRFNELNREFLLESRRERRREVIVFAVVMLVAFWPVLYMIYSVVTLLLHGNPLDL